MTRQTGSRVTIRAIADQAGVSIATVSRVMSGRVPVTAEKQARVREAVELLGARLPTPCVRSEGSVFVYCPYVLADYFGTIVTSIAETVTLHGRGMVLLAGEAAQGDSAALLGLPQQADVAGAVLILPPGSVEDLEVLHERAFPLVVVDPRSALPPDVASVSAAHLAGALSVTGHLTALGHRRIGYIGGPRDWLVSRRRLVGHASALAEVGVLCDPALTRHVPEPVAELGYAAAGELLDAPDRPTALVAFNDKIAVGALRAARERGLRVPEDVSVTGFDDSELSWSTTPTLTTVRQPLQEMGRMAVSLLMRVVARHAVETLHVELATQLIVRESTAPPP